MPYRHHQTSVAEQQHSPEHRLSRALVIPPPPIQKIKRLGRRFTLTGSIDAPKRLLGNEEDAMEKNPHQVSCVESVRTADP